MKSTLIALLLVLLATHAAAQSADTLTPPPHSPKETAPDLHIEDWNKKSGWPIPPKPGITLYFDYTKFFEWLLPKKHPKIPPECDPNFFLRDSIPAAPKMKEDSARSIKEPV